MLRSLPPLTLVAVAFALPFSASAQTAPVTGTPTTPATSAPAIPAAASPVPTAAAPATAAPVTPPPGDAASSATATAPAQNDTGKHQWAIHGQATNVWQLQPAFRSPIQGPQSLPPDANGRETFDTTLYAGFRPWQGAEIWVNSEAAAQTNGHQPKETPGFWDQAYLTGNWDGLRTQLVDSGVAFGLQEQSEVWGNLMGGLRRGAVYDGLTTASLSLDLDKLIGWSGATFFVDVFQIHGRGPSGNLVGNMQLASNIEATRDTKLYDLWLEQNLLNARLNIRIGQEGANDEMMIVDDAALLLNSSFGFPALPATDLPDGGPNYPMATPFVRIRYRPNDAITLVGAAFNGDPAPPGSGDPQLRDAGGTAFRLNGHALLFGEVWYTRNKAPDAPGLPATFKLGAWYDSARFADQRFDTDGLSLANPASSGVPRQHLHDFAFYGIVDQTVWRGRSNANQTVALFLQVMGAPGDRNLSNLFAEAGVNWKAPFAGRDSDVFALAASYEGISPVARRFSGDLVFFGESNTQYATNETVVEATYQYQVAPWLVLQPDAQYVVNPGARIPPSPGSQPLKNAFVIGVRATITF